MNTKETITVDTKIDAKAAAVRTQLTIDWDGMTPENMRDMARDTGLIVRWQARIRKTGTIPAAAEIRAVDYVSGTRAPKLSPLETLKATLAGMEPAERAAWIAANLA